MLSRLALPCLVVLAMRSSCHWARLIGANGSAGAVCVAVHIVLVSGVWCCGLLPVMVPDGVSSVHVSGVAVIVACAVLLLILLAVVSALAMSAAGSVNVSGVAEYASVSSS